MRSGSRSSVVWGAASVVASWCLLMVAFAADVREAIPLPVDEVFERLLTSSESGHLDMDRAMKSLDVLRPLVDHLNRQFALTIDQDLLAAVARGRNEESTAMIQRLVALSIRSLLEEACALASDRSQATPKLKEAYVEYLVVDPNVQRRDFESSKTVRNQFRMANTAAGVKPEVFLESCREITATLDQLFSPLEGSAPGEHGGRVPSQPAQ